MCSLKLCPSPKFSTLKSFDEWFNTPFANSRTGDKVDLNDEEALYIILPFLLRRLEKDIESGSCLIRSRKSSRSNASERTAEPAL
jgi:SNF2 family DNA or RNA helicase